MRYLAIDLGMKRTGLAVGDDELRIASPAGVIQTERGDERLRQLARTIEQLAPDALVVGLPVNMDGSEGGAARRVRELADELKAHFGLPVHLVDERLSSRAADDQMRGSGLTRRGRKQRRDSLAAATILRDFLDALA